MVSRRNYITIAIMFLILFFMFQFTGVMKDQLNQYGVNEYEMSAETSLGSQNTYNAATVSTKNRMKVLYIGSGNAAFKDVVYWWCTYSKRAFSSCETLADCQFDKGSEPDVIVLDGLLVRTEDDIALVTQWNNSGIDLIFARMPQVSLIRSSVPLQNLLGVYRVLEDEVQLNGMHLFDGFLLGGEAIYEAKDAEEEELRQDLAVKIPWYVTGSGTKTYLVGTISDDVYNAKMTPQLRSAYATIDENAVKNMILPAVIWRHGSSKASVFCINGTFLEDISGIGILEAMIAESNQYDIYPVVNAQNFVVADCPAFVSENEKEMQRLYSQSAEAVYKEIIWPSLTALTTRAKLKTSCMISPQFNYEDESEPDGRNVEYYLKLLKESHDEAGWSGTSLSQLDVSSKLSIDEDFWKKYAGDYTFRSLYLRDEAQKATLSDKEKKLLKTMVVNETDATAPIVSYDDSGLTEQRVTSNGVKHTFMDDIKLKSMETALAYSNITLDLYPVTYPQSDEDSWQRLMKKISPNVSTYWKAYESFDATTLSESDERIRRFLALDYREERKKDNIYVSIDHFDEQAWFVLRLNGEDLKSVKGGTYEKIDEGVYLIEAQEEYVSIQVKPREELYYDSANKQHGGGS